MVALIDTDALEDYIKDVVSSTKVSMRSNSFTIVKLKQSLC